MRVLSFNVQNLRLRFPGGAKRLDGARDVGEGDGPGDRALDFADRRLTAAVLARADADLCVLQEVFDRATLDYFHDHLLRGAGAAPWPYRVCLPGNDGAGRDSALMARGPMAVTGHARLMPEDVGLEGHPGTRPGRPVFCRDMLMVERGALTLFCVHLKAPWPDREEAWFRRRAEALALRHLIGRRFDDPAAALWLIVGDLNDPRHDEDRAVAPLLDGFAQDLTRRMPEAERWTWWQADGQRGCPDAMLASPALARRWPDAVPQALRLGLGREAGGAAARLEDVGAHRPHASDHAALVLDLPGI
ncbi:MAG: endonuclease [Pararhodobacter sp.]